MIGLSVPDLAAATVDLGYYVAQTHWGRGIATAGSVIVAYAIGLLGYERLSSRCFEDRASARVLATLGFRPSGYATDPCLATGADKSSIVLRMTTSEAGVG